MAGTETSKPPRPRGRRIAFFAAALLAIAAMLLLSFKLFLQPYVERKLQDMVASHLYARLEIGSLSYEFPYGVTVRDVAFITDQQHGNVRLLSVQRLELALDELPIGSGPIVVKKLNVVQPVVHVVRQADGSFAGAKLARRGDDLVRDTSKQRMKLSDVLRLREFNVQDATAVYEDQSKPDTKPMEWRKLNAALRLTPRSASLYDFGFTASNEQIAQIDLNGSADVDSGVIQVAKLAMALEVGADNARTSPLPAQLQQIAHEFGIHGQVALNISGELPLRDPHAGRFVMEAKLKDVALRPPDQPWTLDEFSVTIFAKRADSATTQPVRPQIEVRVADLSARGMGATIAMADAKLFVDPAAQTWDLDRFNARVQPDGEPTTGASVRKLKYVLGGAVDLSGSLGGALTGTFIQQLSRGELVITIDNFELRPPHFPHPVRDINGIVRLNPARAVIQNFRAAYQEDRFTLTQAIISLADLESRIEALDIQAAGEFATATPEYPPPLDEIISKMRPAGAFTARGVAAIYRGRGMMEPDYSFTITPQRAGLTLDIADSRVVASDIQGEVFVAPKLIRIDRIDAMVFGGAAVLQGSVVPRRNGAFEGRAKFERADLATVSTVFHILKDDGSPRVVGRADARVLFQGELPGDSSADPLASLQARGRIVVEDGNLWSLKALAGIIDQIKFARDALTVGHAAIAFEVKDQKLHLHNLAISSIALGVQGSGKIGFDGVLDLNMIVAPLGDWRERIRGMGIPLIGNVAGELVGGIQKIVNSAQAQLYQFHVTGRVNDPRVTAVAAPKLTNNVADLFGRMLRGTRTEELDQAIGGPEVEDVAPPRR